MIKLFFNFCITVCLFAFTLTIAGCGGKVVKQDEIKIPSWYLEPVKNDAFALYGVGEGSSLQKATNAALNDAASRLRVSVSSTTESKTSADAEVYTSSLKQNISAIVKDVSFNNYDTIKSEEAAGSFYIKIKIDRAVFTQEKTDELKSIMEDCQNRYKNLNQIANALERRTEFKKIIESSAKAEHLALLIFSLSKGDDFNIKEVFDKSKQYKAEYDSFLTKITFVVEDGPIGDVITQGLNDAGLKVSRRLVTALSSVSITITNNTVGDKIYGRYFAKNNTFISVSSGGKLVGSKNITFSGGSSVSQEEAFKESLHNLASIIKNDGIESVLGLK